MKAHQTITIALLLYTTHAYSLHTPPITDAVIKELKEGIKSGDLYVIVPLLAMYDQNALLKTIQKRRFKRQVPGFGIERINYLAELEKLIDKNQRRSMRYTAKQRPDR